jgi:hypothetical protein
VQLADAVEIAKAPARHVEHLLDAAGANSPAVQLVQSEAPTLAWNVPAGQLTQLSDAGFA